MRRGSCHSGIDLRRAFIYELQETNAMVDTTTIASPKLDQVFRSNLLPSLTQWMWSITAADSSLLDVEVFSVVLDANKVIAEIRWRLGKRAKPHALSGIFESIEAKVLMAYVPCFMEQEIFANAEKIAAGLGRPTQDVLAEWSRIKPFLRVHETAMQQVEVLELADPKDLVYIATQQQLGVPAIYSTDPHLRRMGAPLVSGRIDDDLRDYARGMSVTVGVSLGSGIVISVAVPNILRALKATIDWLFRQPLFVQLALAALLASLLRSERVRSWVSETWDEYWPVFVGMATPLLFEWCESQERAMLARSRIQQAFPVRPRRRSTIQFCLGACQVSEVPRSLAAILSDMRTAGYRTKSQDPMPYLRRVMRESGSFIETKGGLWRQLAPRQSFDHRRKGTYAIRPGLL